VPVAPATVISNVSVAAGGRTTVTVAGANGVPAAQNLSAVALSVFAINPAATGFLQVFPAGSSGSGYTTLNFQQGRNAGSFEVVPVSADGRITVSSSASTKVLVRLRGYVTNTVTPRGADWSHYRHGPAHPGVNSLETILDPSTVRGVGQAWVTSISGDASQPTVVGNVVHVGSGDGKLYALNALTGAVMWTLPTRGSIASSPAVVGGVVYAGSGDGRVFALNAGTGAVIWAAAVGVDVGSSPVVVDGVVYVGGFGKVLALNAATGAVIWTAQTGDRVMDSPAVADGVVYVRALDGKAYALDAATGFTEWVTTIGGKPTFAVPASISAPVVANGMVYVAGPWDGKLYGLNAATGAVVWTATAGFTVGGAPAVTGGTVYAVLGTGVGSNVLRALNAATGATIWQVGGGLTNVASTSPVVANGLLYTGTVSGRLDARNPNTGAVLWSDSTAIRSTRPYVSLVVANGAVYARRSSEVSAHHP
jgi:outer membrane protein assembly factor BamB